MDWQTTFFPGTTVRSNVPLTCYFLYVGLNVLEYVINQKKDYKLVEGVY